MEKKAGMPWWVFLGLMNIETRRGARILFWSSAGFAALCIPLSVYLEDWSWAAMMVPISLWYWLCIRWVDRNAAWAVAGD